MPPSALYISHCDADAGRVRALLPALAALGVPVRLPSRGSEEAEPSVEEVLRGPLGDCSHVLVFYSEAYGHTPACQRELAAAWSAARVEGRPDRRVLLVLPPDHASTAHVLPAAAGEDGDDPRPPFGDLGLRCPPLDLPSTGWRAALQRVIGAHWFPSADSSLALASAIRAWASSDSVPTFAELAAAAPTGLIGAHPARTHHFVGRDDALWRLEALLHSAPEAHATPHGGRVVVVHGPSGIGKTWLVAEYIRRFSPSWPGGVIWVRGVSSSRAPAPAGLAVALDPALGQTDPRDRAATALRALQAHARPYLWVLDDLPADLSAEDLHRLAAPTPMGTTLVTTRGRPPASWGPELALRGLNVAEGREMLRRGGPREPDEQLCALAVEDVEGHPYTLHLLTSGARASVDTEPVAPWPARPPSPSAATLAVAELLRSEASLPQVVASRLAAELLPRLSSLTAEAWDLLRIAAQTPRVPASTALLDGVFTRIQQVSPAEAAARRERGVAALLGRGLAEESDDGLVVHRSVLIASRAVDPAPEVSEGVRRGVPAALADGLAEAERGGDLRGELLLIHAVHAALAGDWGPQQAVLAVGLLNSGRDHLASEAQAQLGERALGVLHAKLGAAHDSTRWAHDSLVECALRRADHRALRALSERHLEELTARLGPEHPESLTALVKVAFARSAEGDLAGARRDYERALEAQAHALGPDHPDTLLTLLNLGCTLGTLGVPSVGRPLVERALDGLTRQLGAEHPHTLTARHNLAAGFRDPHRLPEAKASMEQVVAARTRVLGADHPDTLRSRAELGKLLADAGDDARAYAVLEAVLGDQARVLGEGHPHCALTLEVLARLRLAAGSDSKERGRLEDALSMNVGALGAEHPVTLRTQMLLASEVHEAGDPHRALDLLRPVVSGFTRVYGEDGAMTLEARLRQGLMLTAVSPQAAVEVLRSVYDAQVRVFGPEHPSTITALLLLESASSGLLRPEEAIRRFDTALGRATPVLGPEDPRVLRTTTNAAGPRQLVGDFEGARELTQRAWEAQRRLLGADDPDTLTSQLSLSTALRNLGDLSGARRHLEDSITRLTRTLGPRHLLTLSARSMRARLDSLQGDLAAAIDGYRQVLAGQQAILGDDHTEVRVTRLNLMASLVEAGAHEAAALHLRVLADFAAHAVEPLTAGDRHVVEVVATLLNGAGR